MYTSKKLITPEKSPFFSWQLTLLKFLIFALAAIACEKPVGSLVGHIALEQKGFGQYTYDMRQNHVYAVATGPRGDNSVERGVWIKPDGTFRIDQLPCGEYSLKIRATGYSTNYLEGFFVEQGKITQVPSPIAMEILEPSAHLASNSRVFTTKEQPRFWLEASGGVSAQVKIYKQGFLSFCRQPDINKDDMEIFSDLTIYKPNQKILQSFDKLTPVVALDRKLQSNSEDWSHTELKLANTLDPGDYFVVANVTAASGKTIQSMSWFTVTDLGLVVKSAPEQILVRAIDLTTLKPKAAVNLYAVENKAPYRKIAIGACITKEDGFVSIPTKDIPGFKSISDLLICGIAGAHAAYGGISSTSSQANTYQTYFYTERPIYRLGQTVYYKGISRMLSADGFRTPKGSLPLSLVIEDPDNNKIWQGTTQTNSHGTFHGTFDIPEDGKTGAYQLTIKYPDNSTDYERFEVAQYRKPEYQVEVTSLVPRVVAGSKLKARIKATYYFGAPVTNARVKYSVYAAPDWSSRYKLMPRPAYYDYFDDWSGDDYGGDYSGDYICEGYAQTDDSGEAVVEFDTKAITLPQDSPGSSEYMDRRYKIEAEVTDLSRISVVSSGYAQVTAGNFALFVEPQDYVCKAGQPLAMSFTAVDYDRKPVRNQKVQVKLVRYLYDSVHYEYKGTKVEETYTATTGDDGKGTVVFKTRDQLPTDTYYITAEATDSAGHNIYDQNSIWIASASFPYQLFGAQSQTQPFTVKLDKPVYRPGDTAKIMIAAPTDGTDCAEAIISIESTKIHTYKTVVMKATAELVEIPIDASYAPNVYVTACYVGKNHQFYSDSEMIKVSPQEHFLNVSITTDKEKYKPGDNVNYKLTALYPDGKPAANCEFSLGVVDESIYAIRPETAQDIQKFFWRKRDNWVNTICSFPEQYSGGPDKIEPRMRKDFRDTAAWMPELITDNNGVAVAAVKLPDNLTTWRATVRGTDMETNVGQSLQKIISTQDLIVRLALPRFFSQGDEGLITAIVHNYTDTAQQISLNLTATPQFQVSTNVEQSLSAAPDKPIRYSWPVKVIASGNATISVKAIGQTAGDAMELQLPVRPLGITTFNAKSGLMSEPEGSQSIPIGLGADASPETAKCSLTLAASSIGPVLGNFKTLIDYPYGCTEQTTSRLVPSTIAMRLHQALGLPLAEVDRAKFRVVFKEAMTKLHDYQHDDGGWGWWQWDESNAYLTSYVMEGLYLVSQVGYNVDAYISADQRQKAKDWLAKSSQALYLQLKDPKYAKIGNSDRDGLCDLACMQYVLSLYGQQLPDEITNWELGKLPQEYPEGLSYLTLALSRSNSSTNHKAAQQTYNQLVGLANKEDTYTDWDHTEAMMRRLNIGSNYFDYSYRFTGSESTALALRAVLAVDPQNTTLIESIKQWLLVERGKDGWDNTKTTAQVLRSLMEEELTCRTSAQPSYSTSATLGGSKLISLVFNLSNQFDKETTVDVPVSTTLQNLEITKQGPGRLFWSSLLTYWRKLSPGDQINEKSMPPGLSVTRQFFRLKPTITTSDGKIHFATEPIGNGPIHSGETIMMKVLVESPIALPYVILDAALPSGGEVVSNDPREALEKDSDSNITGDWGSWWWSHQDILDDRIVFFATQLPQGKSEFHTMIRMELPGTLQMNPITLEGMYTKKVRAYSMLDSLKVTE